VKTDDIHFYIVAWKFRASTFGEFTRAEFVESCIRLKIETIDDLKRKLPIFVSEIADLRDFKDFYGWLFTFSLEPNQKALRLDYAIDLWRVILQERFIYRDQWFTFLQGKRKAITKDLWNQLYEFIRLAQNDLDSYDFEGAWPVVMDEFVEYLKADQK